MVRDGDDYQLHDFKSTNGTFVNGEPIMAVKLKDGASIRFGSVELRYESGLAKVATLGAGQEMLRASDKGSQSANTKDRGMAKRMKPEYAAGALLSGPLRFSRSLPPNQSLRRLPSRPTPRVIAESCTRVVLVWTICFARRLSRQCPATLEQSPSGLTAR